MLMNKNFFGYDSFSWQKKLQNIMVFEKNAKENFSEKQGFR